MKIYISADIEGITGIVDWNETEMGKDDYIPFAEQMIQEVKAACEGAVNAGAEEIWIKDAHHYARNLKINDFPTSVKLIRGWSGHPFCMMQELDESFDAVIMIGYHSGCGSNGNPLAHTLDVSNVQYIKINDEVASEFLINAYASALVGVPVVFVSGDEELCKNVIHLNENIKTLAANKGIGNSVISIHPETTVKLIKDGVELAINQGVHQCNIKLPSSLKIEIGYVQHAKAYRASFYPGAKQLSVNSILYETDNYFDVLRLLQFVL
ncbi:M55 family metallopeptidase [Natronincola ferrireducens]|uniref:D-amino peptidase n=1 Tax=Natronincola ferrireducens TaxID=393762 RepID=A0A1G9G4S6_9FIRM|nr:M55 family metallopeptidase [Natronincola ferrireducens]SDK95313.1 D-amino peptidase [Natronincola ferrireducens]